MPERGASLEEHAFEVAGVPLFLTVRPRPEAPLVLLLHGASARHETFRFPPPVSGPDALQPRSLMDWLHARGFEPWLLDWRGSGRVVDALAQRPAHGWAHLDLDAAAALDVPEALRRIRALRGPREIAALGHCLGAAVLAQAIARGSVSRPAHGLSRLVLLTLGLFYEPPLDGRLKSQDHVLERLLAAGAARAIDPRKRDDWPEELAEFYRNWPNASRPHPEHTEAGGSAKRLPCALEMCDRLSFMYGAPYFETNLAPGIHHETWTLGFERRDALPVPGEILTGRVSGASGVLAETVSTSDRTAALVLVGVQGEFQSGERLQDGARDVGFCLTFPVRAEAALPAQFGAIPLRMYVHAARNARRGWAASWNGLDDDASLLGGEALARFAALEQVTLITGEKNQLWHRSSIDRMGEWLGRAFPGRRRRRLRRRVLPGYGHQDLLWGRRASLDVFPVIESGLGGG